MPELTIRHGEPIKIDGEPVDWLRAVKIELHPPNPSGGRWRARVQLEGDLEVEAFESDYDEPV